jgi:hypothetical protein
VPLARRLFRSLAALVGVCALVAALLVGMLGHVACEGHASDSPCVACQLGTVDEGAPDAPDVAPAPVTVVRDDATGPALPLVAELRLAAPPRGPPAGA